MGIGEKAKRGIIDLEVENAVWQLINDFYGFKHLNQEISYLC